jgi:hypothetical protein
MALNIQNLIEAIEAKLAAADSSMSLADQLKLISLQDNYNASTGVLEYRSRGQLPTADSSQYGQIVFTKDTGLDTRGRFYVGTADGWVHLATALDSDENASASQSGPIVPLTFPGTTSGYDMGGSFNNVNTNTIHSISLVSDGNAVLYSTFATARRDQAPASSTTHGYNAGQASGPGIKNIEKFSFGTATSSVIVGSLGSPETYDVDGNTSKINGFGYATGGWVAGNYSNPIQKWSFATDGNSTSVGTLTINIINTSNSNSSDYGYVVGGATPSASAPFNRFPFAADGNATNVGSLAESHNSATGNSSLTHGYTSADGVILNGNTWKFSFASGTPSLAVTGQLSVARYGGSGISSETFGYVLGGFGSGSVRQNIIDKFPYASDGNSVDVGDLLGTNVYNSGSQY